MNTVFKKQGNNVINMDFSSSIGLTSLGGS